MLRPLKANGLFLHLVYEEIKLVKLGDIICSLVLLGLGLILYSPEVQSGLWGLAQEHRPGLGVLVFAFLGTLGETLSWRLSKKEYPGMKILAAKCLMWSFHGLVVGIALWLVNGGVVMTQTAGFLPWGGYATSGGGLEIFFTSYFFSEPFFSSLFFNLGVILVLLAVQKLGESAWEDIFSGRLPRLERMTRELNLTAFIRREVVYLPFLRIPMMTLVFMLPQELWLYMTAVMALGILTLTGLSGRG